MYKRIFSTLISLCIIPIAIFSVRRFSNIQIGSTAIWWLIESIILLIFIVGFIIFYDSSNNRYYKFVKWYLLWVIFCIVRGIFVAEIYWDYKALITNTFALLIPLVAYIVADNNNLQSILSYFIKFSLPLSLLVLIPVPINAWGWYFFPVGFLLLFFPVLKLQWKILLLIIATICILGDLSARSLLIKYSLPILIFLLYYIRFSIVTIKIIEIARKVFIIAPWVFFILAVSGIFNVFNMKEYLNGSYFSKLNSDEKKSGVSDIRDDSRTFIYQEVLESAIKYDYWLIGRSPARGNETNTKGFIEEGEQTGRKERIANEANIPNVLTWLGVVGVLLYFLVFYKASSLAISYSNNIYSKLIGLFVAFRWMYAWVEDPYLFDLNNITIWLMLGACYSSSFRKMNNLEVKLWIRGIFDKNYQIVYRIYALNSKNILR